MKHMTNAVHPPIKLFQFPRMFGIPNLSPFCCKLETWLRITRVPYEVVDTLDPRKGPKGKLPFIEDAGMRIADSSRIVDHLVKIRGVDPDGRLNTSERAIVLLVQRTLEEQAAEENGYRLKTTAPSGLIQAFSLRWRWLISGSGIQVSVYRAASAKRALGS